MQFVIEKNTFLKSLARLQGVVEKRNIATLLSNALLTAEADKLKLAATDLDVTVLDSCPASVDKEGTLALNARKLYDIIRELPEGTVKLEADADLNVTVTASAKLEYKLLGMNPEDYPKLPSVKGMKFVKVPAKVLHEMFEKTVYAAAREDFRYALNGVFVEKTEDGEGIRMVATDGHRLALVERKVEGADAIELKKGIILPKKGIAEINKMLSEVEEKVEFGLEEKSAAFKLDSALIIMRLVEGKFPDYRKVFTEDPDKKAVIQKEEFMRNLRRAALIADDKTGAIKFTFKPGLLVMESKNPSQGSFRNEMEIEYEGSEFSVGFNDRYLSDILNTVDQDKIIMEMKDEMSPATVSVPDDPGYKCVIMPMRL